MTGHVLLIDLFDVLLKQILAQKALRLHNRAALKALLCLLKLLIRRCYAEGVERVNGAVIGPESLLGGEQGIDVDLDILDLAHASPSFRQNLTRFEFLLLVALKLILIGIGVLLRDRRVWIEGLVILLEQGVEV